MNTKKQFISNFPSLFLIRSGLLNFFIILLPACTTPPPYISFLPEPKVYNDDEVAITFGMQHHKLQEVIKKLTTKELQEVYVKKQATRLDTNISAAPAGTSPVKAPDKIESDNIDLTKLEIPGGEIGLSYTAALRKKMNEQWNVLEKSLFLSGAQFLKNKDNNLILVGIDVSVNNDIPADMFGDTKRFAYIRFTITEDKCEAKKNETEKDCLPPKDIRIYSLKPEFNSTVSKESLITDTLEDYQGEFGGTTGGADIKGAFRYQRALYEGYLRLVEQPLQFAVYGSKKNEFGCALGPIRQIVKRSWINPARIFGNKYRIDHIIKPGFRRCYAFIVLPQKYSKKKLYVNAAFYRRDFLNEGDIFPAGGPNSDNEQCGEDINCGLIHFIGSIADSTYRKVLWGDSWSVTKHLEIDIPSTHQGNVCPTNTTSSEILRIYPAITSTFLVNTTNPVSSSTRVFIGPTAVDPGDVEILGRTILKVTVKQNKTLQALLGKNDEIRQKMVVLTPGSECSMPICNEDLFVTLTKLGDTTKKSAAKKKKDPNLKEETVTKKFVYK